MRRVRAQLGPVRQSSRHGRRGFALVFVLPLLALIAIVSLASFAAAIVDQRMAANVEQRERAFQAAEFAIAQALRAPGLGTATTYASPLIEPAAGGVRAIAGSAPDGYAYRAYFDRALPPADAPEAAAAGVLAFHFVVEATGHAGRGARDVHVQGFRLLRPAGWTADPPPAACAPDDAGCEAAPTYPAAERTFWLQVEAE
jgi:PilX N-terminal